MSAETLAALLYTALAFALGFLLGPLREFVLVPRRRCWATRSSR